MSDMAEANYRVVGGHMVYLLGRLYPTDTAARVTADADAGMDPVAAAEPSARPPGGGQLDSSLQHSLAEPIETRRTGGVEVPTHRLSGG